MNNFIKLDKVCEKGNYRILINVNHIVSIAKGHSNNGTYLTFVNGDKIEVVESEEQVLERIVQTSLVIEAMKRM